MDDRGPHVGGRFVHDRQATWAVTSATTATAAAATSSTCGVTRMGVSSSPRQPQVLSLLCDPLRRGAREHYNQARPHQGLGLRPPCRPADVTPSVDGGVERRDRLAACFMSTAELRDKVK